MSKRIAATVVVLCVTSVSAWGREGFGFTKKAADMTITTPPALNVAGTRVAVSVKGERTRLAVNAEQMEKSIGATIEGAEGGRLRVGSPPDVTIAVDLQRLDVEERSQSKVEYRSEKRCCDKNGKSYYQSVPHTKYYKTVEAKLEGTYKISGGKGRQLDSGDVDEKFARDYENGTPSTSETEAVLLKAAARKIAARIVPTQSRVTVLVPKGSFESFIPLAETNSWDRYLQSVESVGPISDPGSEAYRQYALGVAKEGLAYATAEVRRARELLRESAEHYRTAIQNNPGEKLFSEAHTSIFDSAGAPLPRVQASIEAYDRWQPGGGGPTARVAAKKATGSRRLGNQQVVDMKKAGLSDENIKLAIDGAESLDFDTSPDGLIALSKAGVSNSVIKHMQKKQR